MAGEEKRPAKRGRKGKLRNRKKKDIGNLGKILKNIHSQIDTSDIKSRSNQDKSLLKVKQKRLSKMQKMQKIKVREIWTKKYLRKKSGRAGRPR